MDPEDLRGAVSLAHLLTSLKQRRPPTEPLLCRKFDALSRPAVDALPFLVERAVVATDSGPRRQRRSRQQPASIKSAARPTHAN